MHNDQITCPSAQSQSRRAPRPRHMTKGYISNFLGLVNEVVAPPFAVSRMCMTAKPITKELMSRRSWVRNTLMKDHVSSEKDVQDLCTSSTATTAGTAVAGARAAALGVKGKWRVKGPLAFRGW